MLQILDFDVVNQDSSLGLYVPLVEVCFFPNVKRKKACLLTFFTTVIVLAASLYAGIWWERHKLFASMSYNSRPVSIEKIEHATRQALVCFTCGLVATAVSGFVVLSIAFSEQPILRPWSEVARRALPTRSVISIVVTIIIAYILRMATTKWPASPSPGFVPRSDVFEVSEPVVIALDALGGNSSKWNDTAVKSIARNDPSNVTKWASAVKQLMGSVWQNYRERAWGFDDFLPETGEGKNFCKCGLLLIESLDTLYLMGMFEEFDEAQRWIETTLDFDSSADRWQSFFEITIRVLGGLLGAHSVSGRAVFLEKAQELGIRLLESWAETGDFSYPKGEVNVRKSEGRHFLYMQAFVGTAEISSCQLEFRYLSHHTGDPRFAEAADSAWRLIFQSSKGKGLLPIYYHTDPPRPKGSFISFGARGDSYYEYLIKGYLQTNRTEHELFHKWKLAMDEMFQRLAHYSDGDQFLYIAKEEHGEPIYEFDHLACFVPGMLMLAHHELRDLLSDHEAKMYKNTAAELTRTCHAMYDTRSGLAPEIVDFSSGKMKIKSADAFSLLRPEAAEAMYYMYYFTGDHKYQVWANEILQAIQVKAMAAFGPSAADKVDDETPRLRNSLESFFFAETLKYLYLIQMPRDALDLGKVVLNTEAHILTRWRPEASGTFARGPSVKPFQG